MDFLQTVNLVKDESLYSVAAYLPEIALVGTIVVLLLLRIPRLTRMIPPALIALVGVGVALFFALDDAEFLRGTAPTPSAADAAEPGHAEAEAQPKAMGDPIFSGLLVFDGLTVFFRVLLLGFLFLLLILTWLTGMPDSANAADIYTLMLGSVIGMCIMVSANNLLMVFFGVEMASVPSYALAGILKGRRQASEASLKFAVYGAGAAGVMLYGISLLAGALGTAHLPTMATQLAVTITGEGLADKQFVLFLGGLMLMVGLAFKLSAFPFHFWCPDVFEGATAEVNAFLSVASKAAALGLLVRVAVGLGGESLPPAEPAQTALVQSVALVADDAAEPTAAVMTAAPVTIASLEKARDYIVFLIGLLAAFTATFGNLAAYAQTNIKRLMAYSTIAHAGYMMMPVAAAVQLMGVDPVGAREAVASLVVYVATYLFMNLGVFAVIAFLRNRLRSEEIADYAGLIRQCPGVTVCMALILFSLVGLPPLAGFLAKFWIFASLWHAGLFGLLIIGGLNTVVSLFYYLRVVKVMAMDAAPDERPPIRFSIFGPSGAYVALITLPVAFLIFGWEVLWTWSLAAASNLF